MIVSGRRDGGELTLSIGEVIGRFELHGATPLFVDELRRLFGAFALPRSRAVAPAFSVRVVLQPGPLARRGERQPRVRVTPETIRASRWDSAVRLQVRDGIDDGPKLAGHARCQMTPFAFDTLLRVLWSELLPRAGGALFHACGIHEGERGILTPGPSGAGKTTLARKVPDAAQVLSDEVVAVFRGGGRRWRIGATPFFGELQRGAASRGSWPLAAVAFLEKREALVTSALAPAEAVFRALECLLCFSDDDHTVQRNLALVLTLCSEVPAVLAGSQAETSFAELIEAWDPFLLKDDAPVAALGGPR